MYCFVDESGNTGLNLFDASQPILYYGVLTCKLNLDIVAQTALKKMRKKLGVQRLHASELGVARLTDIGLDLARFSAEKDIRFSLLKVVKPDHAVISFFDQVFDAGMNKAVPWEHYCFTLGGRRKLYFAASVSEAERPPGAGVGIDADGVGHRLVPRGFAAVVVGDRVARRGRQPAQLRGDCFGGEVIMPRRRHLYSRLRWL